MSILIRPGLTLDTVSGVSMPTKPIFRPLFVVMTAEGGRMLSPVSSSVTFEQITGNRALEMFPFNWGKPKSNSWFPTVATSYFTAFIISMALKPLLVLT